MILLNYMSDYWYEVKVARVKDIQNRTEKLHVTYFIYLFICPAQIPV